MSILLKRKFWPIFWTQFCGAFNDNLFKNALVILVTFKAYSLLGLSPKLMVALAGGIFILPFFLFSATSGQIADKYPKHQLVKVTKFWELIVMLLGAWGYMHENIALLFMTLFLMGFQSTLFGPVKFSIIPELVTKKELTKSNAFIEMGTFLAILLGTIIGGTIIGLAEFSLEVISIAVIGVAAIGLIFSCFIPKLEAQSIETKIDWTIFKPTIDIIKICRESKPIWKSILAVSWFWFLGAIMLSIFPVYVKENLNGTESVVTFLLGLFSVGIGIGSFIGEKFSHKKLELGLVPMGSYFMSLFLIDLYFINLPVQATPIDLSNMFSLFNWSYTRMTIDLLGFSISAGCFILPLYTFLQQKTSSKVRSRVIAGNNIINALLMVIASLVLMGLFSFNIASPTIFLIMGLTGIIVSYICYKSTSYQYWRLVCQVLSTIFYRVDIKGLDNIPKHGAAILICNHVSFVDWLIISGSIKRPIRYIMHYVFMKIPIVKYFFTGTFVIPIAGRKENPAILVNSFKNISQALENGELVCLFPEGEITHTGDLATFKPGINKIIETNPCPVIPMTLHGLYGSFFSRKYGKACSAPKALITNMRPKIGFHIDKALEAREVNAQFLEGHIANKLSIG